MRRHRETWVVAALTIAVLFGLAKLGLRDQSPEARPPSPRILSPDSAMPPAEELVFESASRSSEWPRVRAEHIKAYPECAACGQRDHVNVHHVVPFNTDPSKELDPTNLITLCVDGPGGFNCHLLIGHGGSFRTFNPNCRKDAAWFREKVSPTLGWIRARAKPNAPINPDGGQPASWDDDE